jgi:hypothetical protein
MKAMLMTFFVFSFTGTVKRMWSTAAVDACGDGAVHGKCAVGGSCQWCWLHACMHAYMDAKVRGASKRREATPAGEE